MARTDFPAWSIAIHGREEVEKACLRLQDQYGLDVNAVLFCYWHGAHRGIVGEDLWPRIDAISRQWQSRLARPLREARRWLKNPGFEPDRELQALRERIKANEIAAELSQQRMMQAACANIEAGAPDDPAAAARRNALTLLKRQGLAPEREIEDLLAAVARAAFEQPARRRAGAPPGTPH